MKKPSALAAVAILVAALLYGIDRYRHRFVLDNAGLARLLPESNLSLIFVDMVSLRKADLADLLRNVQVAPDEKYKVFVDETGFDYIRDLDAVAVATDGSQTFLAGIGNMPWDRLKHFAATHGGICSGETCWEPATAPGRWIGFKLIQPDVVAVAVSADRAAVGQIKPGNNRLRDFSVAPILVEPSHAVLKDPAALPLPFQILAISLQSSQSVVLTAQLGGVYLKAHCENAATADTARRQLEIQTRLIRTALGQGPTNQVVNKDERSTVAGLLGSGTFQVVGSDVLGRWEVYPELVRALRE